jgi:hypothetical protein
MISINKAENKTQSPDYNKKIRTHFLSSVERKCVLMLNAGGSEFTF